MFHRRKWLTTTAAALFATATGTARAQAWPSRPIRLVVPYPAGGSTDLAGRLIAQQLSLQLGVPVVVENIGGVGGVTGSEQVRRAPPDGHTIVLGSSASHSVNMVTLKTTPYDPIADFAPIMLLVKYANAAFVASSSPIHTLADLQAAAKKDPGLPYATAGAGSSSYLTGELLRWHSKLDMRPVHYKGIGPAMQDVIAGHVPLGFGDVLALAPHVASGRLRLVALGSAQRMGSLPNVPAIAETYPGFESVAWQAFYAPKGTPEATVQRLNTELAKAVHSPEVRGKLESSGAEVSVGSPGDLHAFMRADIQRWRDLAHDLKLTFE